MSSFRRSAFEIGEQNDNFGRCQNLLTDNLAHEWWPQISFNSNRQFYLVCLFLSPPESQADKKKAGKKYYK